MILAPSRLSWRRLGRLIRHPESTLLRLLEEEWVETIQLNGVGVDAGGGARSRYEARLRMAGRLYSMNLDPGMRPAVVTDLSWGIPLLSGSCDFVVCLNTLEHVWNDGAVLREIQRVLKPGGLFVATVPFLYRVHGSPRDYHRPTGECHLRRLAEVGFGEGVEVRPLVFGAVSSALSLVEFRHGALVRRLLRFGVLGIGVFLARWPRLAADDGSDTPLGYALLARK